MLEQNSSYAFVCTMHYPFKQRSASSKKGPGKLKVYGPIHWIVQYYSYYKSFFFIKRALYSNLLSCKKGPLSYMFSRAHREFPGAPTGLQAPTFMQWLLIFFMLSYCSTYCTLIFIYIRKNCWAWSPLNRMVSQSVAESHRVSSYR